MSSTVTSWRGLLSRLTRNLAVQTHTMTEINQATTTAATATTMSSTRPKLHGREFYRAIGEPRYIVAPMVDRSEFAWRVLTRSYLDEETSKRMLAYSPMMHARLFSEKARFRDEHFLPTKSSLDTVEPPSPNTKLFLDGNPSIDRPLFVQFCANKPNELLEAAKYVAPYCDAVDLNLGCPQGIARSGHYGAFLQEDWDTIHSLISTLHKNLSIPVTAKMRILDTKEKTLAYAKMILSAGASILTVHGRRREQKGHNTGLADWAMIRYLRDNLPPETVLFANGNILNGHDLDECLHATGADGIMSAEGNLSDPTIFAKQPPPSDLTSREYWRSPTDSNSSSVSGYRIDAVFRRYLDIIYKYVLEQDPPVRKPLWIPGDDDVVNHEIPSQAPDEDPTAKKDAEDEQPPTKKRKKNSATSAAHSNPNLRVMQGHLFGLLRPMLTIYTDIRDTLARTRAGDLAGFEKVLGMVEEVTRKALQQEADENRGQKKDANVKTEEIQDEHMTFSQRTAAKYKRPWWVAQPYIRPLPEEAIANGALTVNKKERSKGDRKHENSIGAPALQRSDQTPQPQPTTLASDEAKDLPKSALVCG